MIDPFHPAEVRRLADAQPSRGTNSAGPATRAGFVHRVKRATPGRYSALFSAGPSFQEVFFPGTGPSPDDIRIDQVTGLNDDFFARMAVLCLCGQIARRTVHLKPEMQTGRIDAELAAHNSTLRERAWAWYLHTLTTMDGPVRAALAAFPTEAARQAARTHYLTGLTSATWINLKRSQRELGQWRDREWELYHHWIKLAALGVPPDDIDLTIVAIRAGGLEIPREVGPGAWRTWSPWSTVDIAMSDVEDAVGPILAPTIISNDPGPPSFVPEGHSFEFTARNQPGNPYRRGPASSHFGPDTRVALAGDGLRAG